MSIESDIHEIGLKGFSATKKFELHIFAALKQYLIDLREEKGAVTISEAIMELDGVLRAKLDK
jgi:hypothetical protein